MVPAQTAFTRILYCARSMAELLVNCPIAPDIRRARDVTWNEQNRIHIKIFAGKISKPLITIHKANEVALFNQPLHGRQTNSTGRASDKYNFRSQLNTP